MKHEQYMRFLEEKFRKDIAEIIAIQKETAEARKKREKALEIEQKAQEERTRKWDKGMEELRAAQREVKLQLQKTSQEVQKTSQEVQKTSQEVQKTSQETQKLDQALNKFIGFEGSRWGKLGENLVKGNLVKRLSERGIKNLNRALTEVRIGDVEYDIIVVNGKEVVIVEVKSSLRSSDVRKFIKNINKFKILWPVFKDHIIYGAISYLLKSTKPAIELAKKEGFFVIEAVGDVIIKNEKSFKPKVFA